MKRAALLVFALLTCLSLAQKKSSAQVAVEKQIAVYIKAMQNKDLKGVQSVMMPDFKAINQTGMTAQGKDVFAQLANFFKQAQSISISCSIQSFKLEKGNAHILSHNVMSIKLLDERGSVATLKSDSKSDEIWIPVKGTYKIQSSRQTENKVTLNGRPIKNGG